MRRRIRAKREMMLLSGVPEMIKHDPRLHPRALAHGVKFENVLQVFGEIHHHGDIAALPGQARAAAARQHGRAITARRSDRRNDILDSSRNHHAKGRLAIVGPVGGVERAAACVKTHLALHALA